jgi:hypothetical protein
MRAQNICDISMLLRMHYANVTQHRHRAIAISHDKSLLNQFCDLKKIIYLLLLHHGETLARDWSQLGNWLHSMMINRDKRERVHKPMLSIEVLFGSMLCHIAFILYGEKRLVLVVCRWYDALLRFLMLMHAAIHVHTTHTKHKHKISQYANVTNGSWYISKSMQQFPSFSKKKPE